MSPFRQSYRTRLSFLLFASLCIPTSLFARAQVVYLEGDVTIERRGQVADADFGDAVMEGDRVRTGARSTVIIDLGSAGELKLRADSEVVIEENRVREATVSLEHGGLFSRVRSSYEGRFRVRTDTVVAGVRGTEFFTAFGRTIDDRPDLWLCVETGEVLVEVPEAGASQLVRAGEGINILAGTQLTTPRRYRWTLELNWNMDPDAGPVFDTTDLDRAYGDLLDQDYD